MFYWHTYLLITTKIWDFGHICERHTGEFAHIFLAQRCVARLNIICGHYCSASNDIYRPIYIELYFTRNLYKKNH